VRGILVDLVLHRELVDRVASVGHQASIPMTPIARVTS
jgi:hypothetical protein